MPHDNKLYSTVNASYIWDSCKVMTLTQNMRLHTTQPIDNLEQVNEFADCIIKIGERSTDHENNGESLVEISDDLLINVIDDPISSIVNATYTNLFGNLDNLSYFQERAILAPTLKDIDNINDYMLFLILIDERMHLSYGSICKADTYEFLNCVKLSGMPNELKLKVEALIMFLKNIDKSWIFLMGLDYRLESWEKHVRYRSNNLCWEEYWGESNNS